jgi:hypothetical protein
MNKYGGGSDRNARLLIGAILLLAALTGLGGFTSSASRSGCWGSLSAQSMLKHVSFFNRCSGTLFHLRDLPGRAEVEQIDP